TRPARSPPSPPARCRRRRTACPSGSRPARRITAERTDAPFRDRSACHFVMTFHYDIHPEQRTIHLRYTGAFTVRDLIAAATLLWSDPRYSQTFDGIVDLTDVSLRVTQSDLRALIA